MFRFVNSFFIFYFVILYHRSAHNHVAISATFFIISRHPWIVNNVFTVYLFCTFCTILMLLMIEFLQLFQFIFLYYFHNKRRTSCFSWTESLTFPKRTCPGHFFYIIEIFRSVFQCFYNLTSGHIGAIANHFIIFFTHVHHLLFIKLIIPNKTPPFQEKRLILLTFINK